MVIGVNFKINVSLSRQTKMKIQFILILSGFLFFGLIPKSQSQSTSSEDAGIPITKGTWFSSLSLSASQKNAENERQLFATYLTEERRSFSIRLDPGYVIKDNLGIGLGLLYGSTEISAPNRQAMVSFRMSNSLKGEWHSDHILKISSR
jgi:hypothetical protein